MSSAGEKKSLKRKECTVNWTRNMILQLIELYESYPNLWDCSSENYKNRNLRKSAMDEISNKFGIPAQEVKDKIHNLRCQFQSINRKRKHTKSGQAAGDNFEVKWEFYDALKFIDGPTCSNETTMDSLSNEPETLTELLHESSDSEDSLLHDTILANTASSNTSRSNTPLATSCDVTPSSSRTSSVKKKKEQEQQAVLDQCLGVMSKSADSFEIFGDYVADELRNMSSKAPDLQSWAKREIQRILLKMNDHYELKLQQNTIPSPQQPINKEQTMHESTLQIPVINNDPEVPNADSSEGALAQYYGTFSPTYFKM